ncbi:DUF1007 family protein [Roseovarius tibetensis]|uniref:DUF1007 family protein n=1 Tax=Roseovarius tibetensis TaxID=2685897 RepID=UPI003D7FD61F
MKHISRLFLGLVLCLPVGGAAAHPHVFVDVALRFESDGAGHLTGVEVTWRYDDFFSLLILSDMGMDADGDGVLTDAERARLKGFDLEEWPEGFEGDLYIHRGDEKITLDHPVPTGVALEQGRIVATHRRSFGPVPADGVRVEPYDPTYYVDYTLTGPISLPDGCDHRIAEPDLDESQRAFREMLSELSAEEEFTGIEVGNLFSDVMVISCAAPS